MSFSQPLPAALNREERFSESRYYLLSVYNKNENRGDTYYRWLEARRSITRLPLWALLGEVASAFVKICSFGGSGTTNEI